MCTKSLNLFRRSQYYLIKAKEYDFLISIVNLLLLKCAIPSDRSLMSTNLANQLVDRSLHQVRLFLKSCPASFFDGIESDMKVPVAASTHVGDTALKGSRLKSAQFRYSHQNLFSNPLFIKAELLEYLAVIRLEALGLENTVEWLVNEAHLLSFELSNNALSTDCIVGEQKERHPVCISLSLHQVLCKYVSSFLPTILYHLTFNYPSSCIAFF